MFTRTLFSLVILAAIISVLLSYELDESEDIKLLSPDDRAIAFGTYIQSWAQGIELKNAYDNQILPYLTIPTKTVPIYYNTSTTYSQELAIIGGFFLFGVSAYLITQIPLPEFGLGRSDPQLGFELQRDLSEYSDEYYDGIDDNFTYEYPDSFFGSASEKKEKKIKKGRRKLNRRSGKEAKQFSGRGFFERIVSAFNGLFSPIRRSAADTLSGGFEERLKRYEDFWKNKRRSPNRRLSKQGRSEDSDILHTEERIIGPQIPKSIELTSQSSDEGGGHRFYRDRVKEAYRPLYN